MREYRYPFCVREFRDGKMVAIGHNFTEEEAEQELLVNVNQRDFRRQKKEHLAEEMPCQECDDEIKEAENV